MKGKVAGRNAGRNAGGNAGGNAGRSAGRSAGGGGGDGLERLKALRELRELRDFQDLRELDRLRSYRNARNRGKSRPAMRLKPHKPVKILRMAVKARAERPAAWEKALEAVSGAAGGVRISDASLMHAALAGAIGTHDDFSTTNSGSLLDMLRARINGFLSFELLLDRTDTRALFLSLGCALFHAKALDPGSAMHRLMASSSCAQLRLPAAASSEISSIVHRLRLARRSRDGGVPNMYLLSQVRSLLARIPPDASGEIVAVVFEIILQIYNAQFRRFSAKKSDRVPMNLLRLFTAGEVDDDSLVRSSSPAHEAALEHFRDRRNASTGGAATLRVLAQGLHALDARLPASQTIYGTYTLD